MITTLLGGTAAMRQAGKTYLPQWPNEDGDFYKNRQNTATLFPAFSRTIEVLSGKPFSRPITTGEDIPKSILEMFEDIDLQGTNMHSFLANVCESALAFGIAGILVDYPHSEGVKTIAEEKALGLRPYFVKIEGNSLLDFKSKRINGYEVFTQLRFVEMVSEETENEFKESIIEQVRVLDIGSWRTYRKKRNDTKGADEWILHDEGKTSLDKIPFVPIYGEKIGFMQSRPPMAELSYLNVEHWQSKSDQQTILHVARVPVLFGRRLGLPDDESITIGAACAVLSEQEDADLKYVEHTGKAIEAGRTDLQDLKDMMLQIGAELLVVKPGRITVAQTMAEDESGTCALQRIVGDLQDAANQALQLLADWIKEPQGGHISIFRDFGAATLAEASADILIEMNVAGTLSNETLFTEIQRRGMISPDVKWKEEQEKIKSQPPKPGTTQLSA
ncbi:DNA-binding protein [Rahnella sikkimica]|uniref:DNA-binding protein n=2 Tax=Rahnella sikkimica TaxID=1805933 RepID=A0A2L1UWM7_9GAMM|nr:DNA-binding protein [Rahnella sikkimica]